MTEKSSLALRYIHVSWVFWTRLDKNEDEEVNEEMDELFEEEKNLHDDTL